jgi:hypothetical protein
MQDPQLCKALPLDERKKLDRDICKLTAATRSQEFFATGDRGTLHPIRIFGSYKVDDPTKALEMQRRVREQMGELMGGLFPGMGDMGTNGNWRIVDGVRVYEAQLMGDDLPKIIRENIAAVYGDDAVFQEAAVDDHTIVYAIDKKDGGVAHLIPIAKKNLPALAVNRSVTNAMALLPSDANVYVLVDVERLALSTPVLIQQGGRMPAAVAKSDEIPPTQIGPLLAWSATVENGGFTGRFAMDGRDVSEAIATVVKVGRRLSGAHIAPETGTVNKN